MIRQTGLYLGLLAVPLLTATGQTQPRTLLVERAGAIEAASNHLTHVGWLGISPGNDIIVTQPVDQSIRVFDASGKPKVAAGRGGDGPGEYRALSQAGWKGDTVWVFDNRLARVTLLTPQLTVARTVPFSFVLTLANGETINGNSTNVNGSAQTIFPSLVGMNADGTYSFEPSFSQSVTFPENWNRPPRTSNAYVRANPIGAVTRLLAWTPPSPPCDNLPSLCPRIVKAISPNGSRIAIAEPTVEGTDSGTFRLTLISQRGDTVFSRRVPYDGLLVSQAYVDSSLRVISARNGTPPKKPAVTVMPPLAAAFVADDGTTWLAEATNGDQRVWLQVDNNGQLTAKVTLPAAAVIRAASAGRIWTVQRTAVPNVEDVVWYTVR